MELNVSGTTGTDTEGCAMIGLFAGVIVILYVYYG
jgi:hypothetical protein